MRLYITSYLLAVSISGLAQSGVADVTKALVCDRPAACTGGYIDGHFYESIIGADKIGVAVMVAVVGKYVRADILVINRSPINVDVLPSNFVMTEVTPKQKALKRVDGDKLIRSAEKGLIWGNAVSAMAGNMAQQQATTTTSSTGVIMATTPGAPMTMGTYSGTSSTTTSIPDYAARERAAETIRMRNEAFSSFAGNAARMILRANTVLPSQSAQGCILFERDKKEKLVMVSGIVGDTIYQFPFLLTALQ